MAYFLRTRIGVKKQNPPGRGAKGEFLRKILDSDYNNANLSQYFLAAKPPLKPAAITFHFELHSA